MNTEQQLENCIAALEFMKDVPEHQIVPGLREWREGYDYSVSPSCGSPACFGGLLPFIPHFIDLGVKSGESGHPYLFEDEWGGIPQEFLAIFFLAIVQCLTRTNQGQTKTKSSTA